MELTPFAALPSRAGSSGPDDYDQIVTTSRRVAALLPGKEPGQYRFDDVLATLAADPVSRLAGVEDPDPGDVAQALRYLGHDVWGAGMARVDFVPDTVLVQPAKELAWRRQQVAAAVERAAVPVRELFLTGNDTGGVPESEYRAITVRLLQRRLRARWVTAWGLRGHLEGLVVDGALAPASAQRPTTVWRVTS